MTSSSTADRRWLTLFIVAFTRLVVVLDGTIVTIALPEAQQQLNLSDGQRGWVVTAYSLAFGALLLLGGRIADYWGRKRTFLTGMVGFGAASAVGGIAQSATQLIIARGFQGAFAALLAPAALAILTTTFPTGKDRNTAFAVFGSVAGAGSAVGLVLGGVLTEAADWRWCLLANVPIVVGATIAGIVLLPESKAEGRNKYDFIGTVIVVLGLGSLVYGFSLAEVGWENVQTIFYIGAGVALVALFVWVESKVKHPLVPLSIFRSKVRVGAYVVQAVLGTVMIGTMLYLSLHFQLVLHLSPLLSGLGSLPITAGILATVPFAARLLPRVGPAALMTAGPLIAGAAMVYLSFITSDGNYFIQVFPGILIAGVGFGFTVVPLQNLALRGVRPRDAGTASALVNASMQIGGSIGLSVFTALCAVASTREAAIGEDALVHGYSAVFLASAVGLFAAALISMALIRLPKEPIENHDDAAEQQLVAVH